MAAPRVYILAVQVSEEREDRAHPVMALETIVMTEGHMADRVETRTGPLDAYSSGDLRPAVE